MSERTLSDDIAQLRQLFAPIADQQREEWEREGPAATARLLATGATLSTIGGNCPVQAEGLIDDQPFYFRARGEGWELWVGAEADWFTDRAFCHEQSYGVWPDAGWMPQHEALGFIVDGIAAYRDAVDSADMDRVMDEAWAHEWRYRRRQELRAIIALWGPAIRHRPRDSRKGWTIYDGYERNREEEWTVWRALVCTVAILLGRRWGDDDEVRWSFRHDRAGAWAPTPTLAFFDSRDTYGGYDVTIVKLAPGCRFQVFSDGECLM